MLSIWNNQSLFSNNYLEHRLPASDLWNRQKERAEEAFITISKLHAALKDLNLGPGQEAALEETFIRPVLKALGFEYNVQPITQRGFKKKRPDYALFKDSDSYKTASKDKADPQKFFSHSLTVLEAKHWARRLNDTDTTDVLDSRDPTAQTVKYLDDVHYHTDGLINWAILTNGKQWRLFYYRASSRSGNFYEVDLEEAINSGNIAQFLYFYLFFSRDAFVTDPLNGRNWLDQHLSGTEEYAARISARLKDLIFDKVFEGLAEGFAHYRREELSIRNETAENKAQIFKGCLTLLYRLLFLLYAESRNLLPVNENPYLQLSLTKLKRDICRDLSRTGLSSMSKRSYAYWARVESLFGIVANGDAALNVPVYNGGLFDTPKGGFLSEHRMADPYLAEALEILTVDHEGQHTPGTPSFIDYSSLNVRHLGDIYEGLLEFVIRIADEEVFEIRKDGKSIWQKTSEIKEGAKTYRKKTRGEVYIENSRHERKATGSYYTPHYIVEYIVKNTVGPVLAERLERVRAILSELQALYEKQRRELRVPNDWKHWEHPGEPKGKHITEILRKEDEIFHTIFDVKVLDPTMGSGHFLVHTVDFISDRIIAFLADYPENPVVRKLDALKKEILEDIRRQGVRIDESKLTEVNLIKRMVMKRCIYGVDLNDMAVELAKLSLWLDSFTLGAPLSFLDHHLKCGNSLIGIHDISEVIAPGSENYARVHRSLSYMLQVAALTDSTASEAKKSYDLFSRAQQEIAPISRRFDVATARHFMDLGASYGRVEQFVYATDSENEPYPEIVDKGMAALTLAKEKHFFHWRLEFPEVFFSEKGEKENPGFDCIIGNPPYGGVREKSFVRERYPLASQNLDLYSAFIELCFRLLRNAGLHSFIVPTSWQTGLLFHDLRKFLLESGQFHAVINLPFDVFEDAYIDTSILVLQKLTKRNATCPVRVYEFPKYSKAEDLDAIDYTQIDQKLWQQSNNTVILKKGRISRTLKLQTSDTCLLSSITESTRGVLAGPQHLSVTQTGSTSPFFDREMLRYEMDTPDKFISYNDSLPEAPSSFDFFTGDRVLVRRLVSRQDRLMAHVATETFVNKKDIYIFKPIDKTSTYCLLALLNSRLLSYLYLCRDVVEQKDDFRQTTLEGIRSLPIPRISFTTPEKERKERVRQAISLYESEIGNVAPKTVTWQNKDRDESDDEDRQEEGSAAIGTVAGKPSGHRLPEKGLSGEGLGLGGKVYGVREGAGEYESLEGAAGEGEGGTRPVDSTRYFETAQGIKAYSEVTEILAVSVAKATTAIIEKVPEDIHIASEWVCALHRAVAGALFPDWAGRFRESNVTVGTHTPPPYYEVPVHVRLYCDDLTARLSAVTGRSNIQSISETLAYADWRFQWIHPFKDFNGRVGRIILTAVLFKLALPPAETAPSEPEEKTEYLKALRAADAGDISSLTDIWVARLLRAAAKGEE